MHSAEIGRLGEVARARNRRRNIFVASAKSWPGPKFGEIAFAKKASDRCGGKPPGTPASSGIHIHTQDEISILCPVPEPVRNAGECEKQKARAAKK
jgi:hypothetical protein